MHIVFYKNMTSLHLEYLQRIGVAASYYYMAECLYYIENQIQSKREPRVARLVGASGWLPTGQRSSLTRHWFLIKKTPSSAPCAKAQLGLPLVVDPPKCVDRPFSRVRALCMGGVGVRGFSRPV